MKDLKISFFLLLYFLSFHSISSFDEKITISSAFSLEDTTVFSGEGRYSPNIGGTAGMSIWYKGLGIGFMTKLPAGSFKNLGESNFYTISAFFDYHNFFFHSYYRTYNGFFLLQKSEGGIRPTESEKLHPIRSDLSVTNFVFSTTYVLLPKEFSLVAAYYQSARHPKSGLSPLFQLAIFSHALSANTSIAPTEQSLETFWSTGSVSYEGYKSGKLTGVGIPVGLGATGLLNNFFGSIVMTLGPSIIARHIAFDTESNTKAALSLRVSFAMILGYSSDNLFAAAKLGFDEDEGSLSDPLFFSFQVRTAEISAGFRF